MVYHSHYESRKCPKCGHEWKEDTNIPKAVYADDRTYEVIDVGRLYPLSSKRKVRPLERRIEENE